MRLSKPKIIVAVVVFGALVSGALPTSAQNIDLQARPQVCDDPTNSMTLVRRAPRQAQDRVRPDPRNARASPARPSR